MPILLSPHFLILVLGIVFNFVLIFSGAPKLQLVSAVFTAALLLAALIAAASLKGGRIIGLIVAILGLVMGVLLGQQAGVLQI